MATHSTPTEDPAHYFFGWTEGAKFSSLCLIASHENPGLVRRPPCAFLGMRPVNRSDGDPQARAYYPQSGSQYLRCHKNSAAVRNIIGYTLLGRSEMILILE